MTDMTELGRRAVACKHWRWMPGMLTTNMMRVLEGEAVECIIGYGRDGLEDRLLSADDLPDLTNPATLGCLLHLVINCVSDFNTACHLDNITLGTFNIPDEMAEALVAALESAQ